MFRYSTSGVHLVLHPLQVQGTKPCSGCLAEPNLKPLPHILSSGTCLKLPNKIVMHAIQHSKACLPILIGPVLVSLNRFLILHRRSINRFAIFVFVRRWDLSHL
uniref:Uncharacterized protein n=1 Tax=Opuntia streptacantha TaxID=393608 RepID=A0A7C9B211_OPUST